MSDATMEAGRTLDALIAERVMGLVPCTGDCHANGDMRPCHAQPDSPDQGAETRQYSTDIADAWLVVENLNATHWMLSLNVCEGGWWCVAYPHDGAPVECDYQPSAPLAICRVALAAMQVAS